MQCTAQAKEVFGICFYSFQSVLMECIYLKINIDVMFFTFLLFLSLRVDLLLKWFLSGDERDFQGNESFTQNVFPHLFIAFQT